MSGRLADKRCLIVGGTSGIGLAAAGRFLEEGARLAIAGLEPEPGAEAARELSRKGPVHFSACDATVPAQVEHFFQQAAVQIGRAHV